jgi:hypothetical protein
MQVPYEISMVCFVCQRKLPLLTGQLCCSVNSRYKESLIYLMNRIPKSMYVVASFTFVCLISRTLFILTN